MVRSVESLIGFALFQVLDLMFSHDGQELFSCGDVVTKESSDRTILAWDFRTGVILSNQIFQVTFMRFLLCFIHLPLPPPFKFGCRVCCKHGLIITSFSSIGIGTPPAPSN